MEKFRAELAAFVAGVYEGEKKLLVFGEGPIGAKVLLVGEAPGEQESLQGRPFVGRAGKNLDHFLEVAGLSRRELYVTNLVKFRPTKISPAGRIVNRTPTQEEIRLFQPWLLREIAMIRPECVVTLGNVPLRALAGNECVIGAAHGRFLRVEVGRVYAMYHPASVLYNPTLRQTYREDLERLAAHLRNKNITEN